MSDHTMSDHFADVGKMVELLVSMRLRGNPYRACGWFGLHSHTEHGNEKKGRSPKNKRLIF
ncbi:MAG: hypothetical protein L3J88_05190 [Gammaproteobacteria bacterium]|nr:hypothetical protein [Gammaproteobacteria bacterium]MCF6362734.1 hypothetical protein [Gammaproteobacteria bacterium]